MKTLKVVGIILVMIILASNIIGSIFYMSNGHSLFLFGTDTFPQYVGNCMLFLIIWPGAIVLFVTLWITAIKILSR